MEDWREFEYYSIKSHIEKYTDHKVWHQTIIPESELITSCSDVIFANCSSHIRDLNHLMTTSALW